MNGGDRPTANLFRIEGEYWTIAFDGQVCRLRDTRGLRYLAHLLAHPATHVAAVDLITVAQRASPAVARDANGQDGSPGDGVRCRGFDPAHRERARVTVTKGIKSALERIGSVHPALARHLEVTVRRGYVCSYNPDPRVPICWEV